MCIKSFLISPSPQPLKAAKCADLIKVPIAAILAFFVIGCGIGPHPEISSSLPKIIGGRTTDLNEFPFTVALLRRGEPRCSGVIVAPGLAITAAHCVERLSQQNLHLDQLGLEIHEGINTLDTTTGKRHPVVNIRIHPEYWQHRLGAMDFALLEFSYNHEEPIHTVQPASRRVGRDEQETQGTIVGYGINTPSIEPDSFRKMGLQRVAQTKIFRTRGYDLHLGDQESDSCSGDSGGPVLLKSQDSNQSWELAAIISRGPSPCASAYESGVASLIAPASCWIRDAIQNQDQSVIIDSWSRLCDAHEDAAIHGKIPALNQIDRQENILLSGFGLKKIDFLTKAVSAEYVDLSWNSIESADELLDLPNLKEVDLRGNKIKDSRLFEKLKQKNIKTIGLLSQEHVIRDTAFKRISSLGAAAGNEKRATILALRQILSQGDNDRRSLDLATRSVINLQNRDIRSLDPLEGLESIEVVILQNAKNLSRISALLTLPKLRMIDLRGTPAASTPTFEQRSVIDELHKRFVEVLEH
jgi:V8-like Glu-specific endopeptidase